MKKRIIIVLLLCALLFGCTAKPEVGQTTQASQTTTQPTETTAPTETEEIVEEIMDPQPWGEDGLKHLPLQLLETETELAFAVMEDRIIFWQFEFGSNWVTDIKLWSINLHSGRVIAELELPFEDVTPPQIQEDRICICNSITGDIMTLDRDLQIVDQWHREPDNGDWFMGPGSDLYSVGKTALLREDLETGEQEIVLDRVDGLYKNEVMVNGVNLSYSDVDLAAWQVAFFDFKEGVIRQPFRGNYTDGYYADGQWLCVKYADQRQFRVGNGESAMDGMIEEGKITLLPEGYLFEESSTELYLYDTDGRYLFGCSHNPDGEYPSGVRLNWCESLGGYLFLIWNDTLQHSEMILWTLDTTLEHEDLPLTQVDLSVTADQEIEALRSRADALGEKYGLKIWFGDDCNTVYDDHNAELLTDPERISTMLDKLEEAFAVYPQGFFYQLRYADFKQIHIHLVTDLVGKGSFGDGKKYGGFTQPKPGYFLVILDSDISLGTIYHEVSHIIDSYLEWDAERRDDALYSSEGWSSLNPSDFEYTCDYTIRQEMTVELSEYFFDTYGMTNSTEDRARILEHGMVENGEGWRFREMPGAMAKLRYYCECIRDAFDTTGWPEVLPWEQYLA